MDKPPSDQLELFPRAKAKLFHSANAPDLLYWRLPSDKYRVELSDGALIDITKQSPGRSGHPRLYTKMPGSAPDEFVQARNLKTVLVQVALLDQIRALNKSIQIKLKQQDDVASALSDLAKDDHAALVEENARLLAELESLRAAEAKSLALEAENARLGEELAAAKRQTPRVAEPQKKQFCSKVLILRPELVQAMKDRGATAAEARNTALIIQQLSYLIGQGFGKVLGDGRPYIFGTYEELYAQYFLSWSSKRTVRRSFQVAEKLGAIDSKQPEGNISRRKYYALTSEAAILAASGKKEAKMAASRGQNGRFLEEAKMAASSVQGENTTDVGVAAAQPNEKRVQLYAIAATATDPLDFCTQAQKLFPWLKLTTEWNEYVGHRAKVKRPATIPNFVQTWLLRAQPRHGKISPPRRAPEPPSAPQPEEPLTPEDDAQHKKFLTDLKARKSRQPAR